MSRQEWVGATLMVGGLAAIGCVPNNARVARYLEESHGFQCPPDEIRVLSHQYIGSDELFAVEACGRRIEVENGLEFPKKKNEVTAVSEQDIEELRQSLPLAVAPSQLAAAREKAKEYCMLGAEPEKAEQLAIYNASPAAVAECRARVADGTSALGADQDADLVRRDWFRVLNWAFPARTAPHVPSCSRLLLADSEEACACQPAEQRSAACGERGRAAAVAGAPADESGHEGAPTGPSGETQRAVGRPRGQRGLVPYGRGGIGIGYLTSEGADDASFSSATIDLDFSAGFRFSANFAAGFEAAYRIALHEQKHEFTILGSSASGDVAVSALEAGVFATWFPYVSGFHLDAYGGLCLMRRGVPDDSGVSTLPGVIVGPGFGWLGRGESLDVGFGARAYVGATPPTTNYGGTLLIELATHAGPPPDAPRE